MAKDSFIKATAESGDGVYSLLRRYHLDNHSCNFEKFYKLNKLKKNAGLIVGKEYYVPILIYTYNGKTIRSTIGIDNWDLAIRIQNFNEEMLKENLCEKAFQKSRILWVPFHELHCSKADLNIQPPEKDTFLSNQPTIINAGMAIPAGKGRKFPIFGEKHAYVPLESEKLRGKIFYIVAGHGGPDPGAMGKRAGITLCEDEYAYDVSLRLVRMLIAQGATAYMISRDPNDGIRTDEYLKCDYDEVLWGNVKMVPQQKLRLFQRSDIVNAMYKRHLAQGVTDQKMVVIHVDSRSKKAQTDLFFYYHPESTAESKNLAQKLHKTMKRKYKKYRANGQYHGTVTPRDLHMLRETIVPSVYVELGNIRNSFDQQRIILESNRQALAKWLYEGVVN